MDYSSADIRLCPRNKFVLGFGDNPYRYYQFVKASQVRSSSDTILATEFNEDWRIVQNTTPSPSPTVSWSHRPVSGFVPLSGNAIDIEAMPAARSGVSAYRRVKFTDLQTNAKVGGTVFSTLDWVGRNHGMRRFDANGSSLKTTNFLYADGHVVTKALKETLNPKFEWGDDLFSIVPHGDLQQN